MTMPVAPIDIQQLLDSFLESNPEAQQYISKLWYLPADQPPPPDVTDTLRLQSQTAADRAMTIGLVLYPQYALMLDALLALIATQPPPA
jgi:hypothetical protein